MVVDLAEQSGFVGHHEESGGWEKLVGVGRPDADERLGTDRMCAGERDDRLVLHDDAVFVDGAPEHPFSGQSAGRGDSEFLVEDLDTVPTAVLGAVQRQIGIAEQLRVTLVRIGGPGDADAQGAVVPFVVDRDPVVQCLDEAVTELDCLVLVREVVGDDDELVAAEPCQRVSGTQVMCHPFRDADQDLIADVMTEGIIDDFEAIQVEVQHGETAGVSFETPQPLLNPVHQHGPVGDAGQRVSPGPEVEVGLVLLAFGDVAQRGDHQPGVIRLHKV